MCRQNFQATGSVPREDPFLQSAGWQGAVQQLPDHKVVTRAADSSMGKATALAR